MKLVLASNNAKKLKELSALLGTLPLSLVTQGSLGVAEAEEPHITFIENALAKARHASAQTGLPALADDSGLCVDALGGAPGVQSAVYAPFIPPAGAEREALRALQDAANNQLLLSRLEGQARRRASFVCALVAIRSADDPEPLIAFGRWQGEILREPQGEGGFGYDPLMFIPAFGCTVAALDAATKNAHSHRALAAAQLLGLMQSAWGLGQ
ncbi:non-canonical purine NTP pyrophosphatase [Ideonella sp.]|jgi:XTP/dITP diphosphohydrolase|uniref:non-canonical purine NTP pyrophosphatase n=1 Tax=Ideonella sp. TaxID=1929293 RepID=UPI0037BE81E6